MWPFRDYWKEKKVTTDLSTAIGNKNPKLKPLRCHSLALTIGSNILSIKKNSCSRLNKM